MRNVPVFFSGISSETKVLLDKLKFQLDDEVVIIHSHETMNASTQTHG